VPKVRTKIPIVEVIAPDGQKSLWVAAVARANAVAAVKQVIPANYVAVLSERRLTLKRKSDVLHRGEVRKIALWLVGNLFQSPSRRASLANHRLAVPHPQRGEDYMAILQTGSEWRRQEGQWWLPGPSNWNLKGPNEKAAPKPFREALRGLQRDGAYKGGAANKTNGANLSAAMQDMLRKRTDIRGRRLRSWLIDQRSVPSIASPDCVRWFDCRKTI
jgi:hypothetical protein